MENQTEEILEKNFFDNFVSVPLATDKILDIYPVCGPFSVFRNFKYKIKVQPGTLKRGKAYKVINELFLKEKTMND